MWPTGCLRSGISWLNNSKNIEQVVKLPSLKSGTINVNKMRDQEPPIDSGRHLVLTADERTWKTDRKTLFLGEWCRPFARRFVWQKLDAVIARPYGIDFETKEKDHKLARSYERELFPLLCVVLNEQHQTNHDERYWRILMGHWFRRYIEVVINRYQTLKRCLDEHQPSTVTLFSDEKQYLAPLNSLMAVDMFNDRYWSLQIYAQILGYINPPNLIVEKIAFHRNKINKYQFSAQRNNGCSRLVNVAHNAARRLCRLFVRCSDALIINSYLPRIDEILLSISLGQLPQKNTAPPFACADLSANSSLRARLQARILTGSRHTGLDYMVRALLFDLIPVCYLEGYKSLLKEAEKLQWPKKPKLIFTSNSFDTNDVFKVWTAAKTKAGALYVVGQHGSNYGTHRYMNPSIEEETSDRFITWGWADGLIQHTPGYLLKIGRKKRLKFNRGGGILLIELHSAHMLTTWDSVAEHKMYFEDQLSFVTVLKKPIRQGLTVRLHHDTIKNDWDDVARWHEYDPDIQVEDGSIKLQKLISESRLVVHSYDSTGILETLALDVPTVAFWQNGFDHLRESAKPYYQLLVDTGIVHLSPYSAAEHINMIWGDVSSWWSREDVKEARRVFCERYARKTRDPVLNIKELLKGKQ